ncbi:hypothetical protein [Ornithinimicrobium sufpigmenti]|uniref:hypothetical protein n=1 Tax=Ornithinimicrobium sufpigmenti TaxID=2508882 RepID=UPI00103693DB|nr:MULTISPECIES: hypothetical protein [unclassified Ornithinimicrobium]
MRTRIQLVTMVAAVGLLLAACGGSEASGGDGAGEGRGGSEEPAPSGLGVGADYSVLGALAELPPAPTEAYTVQTGDLATASELVGLEVPTEADPAAVGAWIGPLTGAPQEDGSWLPIFVPFPSALGTPHQVAEFHEVAGWSVADVDSFVELTDPLHLNAVVVGGFADDVLDHLPEAADGVRTVGEGDDLSVDLTQATAVSHTGRPVRLALADGKLAVGLRTSQISGWLAGSRTTLADDEQAATLARALDEIGVVSAVLHVGEPGGFAYLPVPTADRQTGQPEGLPEHPFDAVAIGWLMEEDEPRMVLVYHHRSSESAQEAVGQLETFLAAAQTHSGQPLSDLVELVDAGADGPVTVATLRPADPRAPGQLVSLLMSRDVPFVHQ